MLKLTPIITTERCNLRLFVESDVDDLFSLYSDEEVMRFLPGAYTREVAKRHVIAFAELFEERGFTLWAVESKSNGELIGRVGLWPLKGTDEVELGYIIARSHWKHGLATETSAACLEYGFRELQMPFVAAITVTENQTSLSVMEKLGFQFIRKDYYYDTDVLYHRLFKPTDMRWTIRELTSNDQEFLWEFEYIALWDPPSETRRPKSVLENPRIRRLVENWGRKEDFGLVAVDSETSRSVGAIWARLDGYDELEDYGCSYPALGIAIVPECRGQGIGSLLMNAFIDSLQPRVDGLRLGVHPKNLHARRLYEKFGFAEYAIGAGAYPQMKLDFS